MMRNWRGPVIVLTVLVAACLVGGAYLFVGLHQVTVKNSTLLCAFGKAINAAPIQRRAEESKREFAKRIKITRVFAREIGTLEGCPAQHIKVRVDREDRLHPKRSKSTPKRVSGGGGRNTHTAPSATSEGGDAQQSPPPASQQPSPPQGGPPDDDGGGSPPPDDSLLGPTIDGACGTLDNANLPLEVC